MPKEITRDEMFEPIVTSIQEVAAAFKKIKDSKLKERVILLLIKDATGLGLSEIEQVINAAAHLDKRYLK